MPTNQRLAFDVAAHLPGYRFATDEDSRQHWCGVLVGPGGARLMMYELSAPRAARVVVAGWFPGPEAWRHGECGITVRLDRGAAAIAAEVGRRLLPEYLPRLAAAEAATARLLDEAREASVLAAELAHAGYGEVREASPVNGYIYVRFPFGHAEIGPGGGSVSFQLHAVAPAQAREIASALSSGARKSSTDGQR